MDNKWIMELGKKYIMNTYGRLPLALTHGKGAKVWDADGCEYLDFLSGLAVNGLGHCNSELVKTLQEQSEKLWHCSNLYWIEPQVLLAEKLCSHSAFHKVFFCNSGAEANEAAIKLARKYGKLTGGPEKYEIITMEKSFHGRTLAAITATGQPKYHKYFEPLVEGFKYVPFNDIEALQKAISKKTCAVLLEPIQGEGGVYPADAVYLKQVKELCKQRNILLIFDEVQCGMGRTGKLFAYENYGVVPDILTLAKALGGGLPIGAMLATDEVAEAFQPGDHASTFGGNPLVTAVALKVFEIISDPSFLSQVAKKGMALQEYALSLQAQYKEIVDVRGMGLMLGIEFSGGANMINTKCLEKGLLLNAIGDKILRFLPPLNVSMEEIEKACGILKQVLEE
jgi:acetylornithine aminotransferase/acetylornithine/N-succinyldiaminopimelate aminotransferase